MEKILIMIVRGTEPPDDLKRQLKAAPGWVVEETAGGEAAVESLMRFRPDVLVLSGTLDRVARAGLTKVSGACDPNRPVFTVAGREAGGLAAAITGYLEARKLDRLGAIRVVDTLDAGALPVHVIP